MNSEEFGALFARIMAENGLINDVSCETNAPESPARESATDGSVSRETKLGESAELFYRLTCRLLETNAVMNLTAITDLEEIIRLHYADSLALVRAIPRGAFLIDIGCGAGFPSLPLAIARRDLSVLAVDSTEKKVRYVAETAAALGLSNLTAKTVRAEELGQDENMRESADIVTARAVSNLRMLSELCLPLVRVGGLFLSMKGANWEKEYTDAERAITELGGALEGVDEFSLSGRETEEKRAILRIRKVRPTPERYPRPWGKIKNKPL